jgi:hypothetical protein
MDREVSILSFLVACVLAVGLSACGSRLRDSDDREKVDNEFAAFLPKYDDAIGEFAKGRPAKVKSLWSRRPDVTLVGGFGGTVHHGWDNVSARQDWASFPIHRRDGRNGRSHKNGDGRPCLHRKNRTFSVSRCG